MTTVCQEGSPTPIGRKPSMTSGWRSTAGSGLPVSTTPSRPMSSTASSTASSDALGIGAVLLRRGRGLGRLLALRRDQMMHLAGEDLLVPLDDHRRLLGDRVEQGIEPVAVGGGEIAQDMAKHARFLA